MTEMNANNGYMNYQNMLSQVNEGISDLSEVCTSLTLEDHTHSLNENRTRMQNRIFSVGIMGEFRRGKSTVINALLGKEIVPSDIVPTSATLNYIRWDAKPRAEINFKDGSSQEVPVEDLSKYVTKITEEAERMAETVDNAAVYYPCHFCQNGVEIVDTPGLNDDSRMTEISEKVIPTLDAIIMVLVPDSPFSISEADFVRTKVMSSDLGRIIFVLNKIDQVDEEDRPRLIASIKEKIQKAVLEKQAAMYGEDSSEYLDAKDKLAGIRLYPISARNALRGRLKGDTRKVEESGILEFETALSKLLTEERGLLELISPVNSVLSIATEAKATINMRRDALKMESSEFETIQQESMEKLQQQRERKREEVTTLKSRANNLYAELLPEVEVAYTNIENSLLEYAEAVNISIDSIKTEQLAEDTCKRISADIDQQMEARLSESVEKLSVAIQNKIGDELISLQEFAKNMAIEMNFIQNRISPESSKKKPTELAAVGAEIVVNCFTNGFLLGLGGVISGWKTNGLPGALVGGGAGAIAAYGATILAVSLGVVGLPLGILAGLTGMFGGKLAVNTVFKKKMLEKKTNELRSALRENVRTAMAEMRKNRALENWLKDATNSAYSSLTEMLDKEVENTLRGLESSLTQMKLDLQKNQVERDNLLKDMDELDQKLDSVCKLIMPVKQRLMEALNLNNTDAA